MKKTSKYKICSLFTGCGGFDLGFLGGFSHLGVKYPKLPYEITFANDFDRDAVNIYKENYKFFNHDSDDCILHKDIREIKDPEIPSDCDVLLAGFPCQPFSNAGNRQGVNEQRGTLFEEVFKFIKKSEPSVIILENVRGILSSKMPDGTKVPDEIIKRLKGAKNTKGNNIGYKVSEALLLNSSDYGVPQNRYRVIIIATKVGDINILNKESIHAHSIPVKQENKLVKRVLKYKRSLPNVLDVWGLSPQQSTLVPHIIRSWKDIPYEVLPLRFKKIRDDMKKYHSPNFYRRFNYNEICGTITASAQPENCGILHPTEDRRYNVREIARIQSFPDTFTFNNASIPNKYKVIGNAVAPVFAYTLAKLSLSLLQEIGLDELLKSSDHNFSSTQKLLAL